MQHRKKRRLLSRFFATIGGAAVALKKAQRQQLNDRDKALMLQDY
jgi:hypothetical protein